MSGNSSRSSSSSSSGDENKKTTIVKTQVFNVAENSQKIDIVNNNKKASAIVDTFLTTYAAGEIHQDIISYWHGKQQDWNAPRRKKKLQPGSVISFTFDDGCALSDWIESSEILEDENSNTNFSMADERRYCRAYQSRRAAWINGYKTRVDQLNKSMKQLKKQATGTKWNQDNDDVHLRMEEDVDEFDDELDSVMVNVQTHEQATRSSTRYAKSFHPTKRLFPLLLIQVSSL